MQLLTRHEAANYLKISLRSIDKLLTDKKFKGKIYIGRRVLLDQEKLDDYLKEIEF